MTYIAKVVRQCPEEGPMVWYVRDEGMKLTADRRFADRWTSKHLAQEAARFQAKECNGAAQELGWKDTRYTAEVAMA